MLKELIGNKIFLAILLAGLLAQLTKMFLLLLEGKKVQLKDFMVTGGMPSSHSAFVVSLVTIIYLTDGVTTAFIISLVLAIIIIRDAFGVRRSVGEEGVLLDEIAKHLKLREKLHYSMGHTPMQVLVGSLIGFFVAIIVYLW